MLYTYERYTDGKREGAPKKDGKQDMIICQLRNPPSPVSVCGGLVQEPSPEFELYCGRMGSETLGEIGLSSLSSSCSTPFFFFGVVDRRDEPRKGRPRRDDELYRGIKVYRI